MNEDQGTQTESHRIEHYEDEIELIDILRFIWKWKYLILAGIFIFIIVVTIISFIAYKKQPTMYHTTIILKPSILNIDEKEESVFIDSPENIKALIENDFKNKIFDGFNNSKKTKLLNSLEFQVEIPKGSNEINVSLESSSAENGTTKLDYLIKALSVAQTKRVDFFQKKIGKLIEEKKYEFEILLFKEKKLKTRIKRMEKELSDIEAKIKLIKNIKDIPQKKELMLSKLLVENDYLNTFQRYFSENENIKLDLFEIQKETDKLSKEIERLKNEKKKVQLIQIIQPPVSKELPKSDKIKRNLMLSLVVGFLLMLFLSFLLEYLKKHKNKKADS